MAGIKGSTRRGPWSLADSYGMGILMDISWGFT